LTAKAQRGSIRQISGQNEMKNPDDPSGLIRQVRFGPFEANFETGELHKHGLRVKLQEKPLRVLQALLERPGELVTREELRDRLWPKDLYVDFERNLTIAMNKLRTALRDSAEKPRYIETLPRRGYRFVAAVEPVNGDRINGRAFASQGGAKGNEAIAADAKVSVLTPDYSPASAPAPQIWRRAAALVAFGACLVAGAHFAFRPRSSPTAVPFRQRDGVLIAQFDNRSGERVLDGTVEYALSRELSNSPFVSVVSSDRVRDVMKLMRLPANTPLKASITREVCLRDGGIRALVTGRVEKLGTTYVLSADVLDPVGGAQVAGASAEARDLDSVIPAVRRLSDALREKLGEKLSTIRPSNLKLEKVATPSLQALRNYSQGMAAAYGDRWSEAVAFFDRAVEEDPNFASAQLLLGYSYSNQGKEKLAEPHFKKAYELADTAPDRERQFILCTQLQRSGAPIQEIILAYETLVRSYPDHFWGVNNLSIYYDRAGKTEQALEMATRAVDLRPNDFYMNYDAFRTFKTLGNNRPRAEHFRERARRLEIPAVRAHYPGEVVDLELDSAFSYWLQGNLVAVHRELERVENLAPVNSGTARDEYHFSLAEARLSLGEIRQARMEFPELRPSNQACFKCMAAFISGNTSHDSARACAEMGAGNADDYSQGTVPAILLARAGLVRQAEGFRRAIERLVQVEGGAGDPNAAGHIKVVRGEVALARGDTRGAEKLLASGTEAIRKSGTKTFFLGMESLSRILETKGDLTGAIQTAESASREKARMHEGIMDVWAWARVECLRAELYRKADRTADAQNVESELRRLFVFADQDIPLVAGLVDLKEPQKSSSQ
jgi:DNA-binding winged helix-turn-helix (wHTH) protein